MQTMHAHYAYKFAENEMVAHTLYYTQDEREFKAQEYIS